MIFKLILTASLGFAFTACNDPSKTEKERLRAGFNYVPLQDFAYSPAAISTGTEVEILANLHGPESSGDTVFYYQFIVLNKETGDTVRILCPELTLDGTSGYDGKTSTTPLAFDPSAGVTTAFFEPIDSSKSLLFYANTNRLEGAPDAATIAHLLDPSNAIKIVVLGKNDAENKIARFKTTVGALYFKEIPWRK